MKSNLQGADYESEQVFFFFFFRKNICLILIFNTIVMLQFHVLAQPVWVHWCFKSTAIKCAVIITIEFAVISSYLVRKA